jgi:hypothetical protein
MGREIAIHTVQELPLTAAEDRRFSQLLGVIRDDLRAFIGVGNALAEISERKLYRPCGERKGWASFPAFCTDVFDVSKTRAYELINAYQVTENVRNCGRSEDQDGQAIELEPVNEAQCRPLAGLQPDQQRQIWRAVVQNVEPGRKPTASLVSKVAKKFLGETTKSSVRNARETIPADRKISGPLKESFDAFMAELEKEVAAGFKATAREAVVGLLDQLRHTIAQAGTFIEDSAFQGSDDANKLSKAGYKLFRMDKTNKVIKERAGGGWPVHEVSGRGEIGKALPFDTIKEMEEAFTEILKNPMHLRG